MTAREVKGRGLEGLRCKSDIWVPGKINPTRLYGKCCTEELITLLLKQVQLMQMSTEPSLKGLMTPRDKCAETSRTKLAERD